MKTKNLILSLFGAAALMTTNNISYAQNNSDGTKIPVVVDIQVSNPTCNNSSDGMINISFTGGVPPYKVNNQTLAGNQYTLSGLSAGQLNMTLNDSGMYNASTIIILIAPNPIQVNASVSNVTNYGGSNGAINITTSATNPTFIWSTISGSNLVSDAQNQSGLTAGTYFLEVVDENGCSIKKKYTIMQPQHIFPVDGNISNSFNQKINSSLIYPNPSNGTVNVLHDNRDGLVSITNEIGLIVSQKRIKDLGSLHLNPGSYNVTIQLDNGNVSSEQLIVR